MTGSSNFVPNIQTSKNLYVLSITFMLVFASYQGVIVIESSLNVEEGLGTQSVLVIFVVSSISCLTFVPSIIDFYGAKTAIILGEIGFVVYIAANFYPSWYTLIPAAIFHGLTESAPWAGTAVYVSFLGGERWKKRVRKTSEETRPQKSYVYQFFGKFYSFVYAGNILGYGFVFLILMAFNDKNIVATSHHNSTTSEGNNSTSVMNAISTMHNVADDPLSNCAANDCQNDYIYNATEEDLKKFVPTPTSTYILLSLFVVMSAISIVLQIYCLARSPAKFDKTEENDELENDELENESSEAPKRKSEVMHNLLSQLRDTIGHIFSAPHLLIAPLNFYYGLYYAYGFTELTRAYISCTLGVEKLGLVGMVYSATAVGGSYLGGKLISIVGRKSFGVFVMLIHIGMYVFSLFWTPTETNLWMVYLISGITGLGEGTVIQLNQSIIAVFFEKKKLGIAYSVSNLIVNLGIVAATGWSTHFCVYVKIYIHIGCLIVAFIFFIGAEIFYAKNQKKESLSQTHFSDNKSDV